MPDSTKESQKHHLSKFRPHGLVFAACFQVLGSMQDEAGRSMVALYVFESENKGLNLFGADSLIFNDMPSCFGLRINDILLGRVDEFWPVDAFGIPAVNPA